MRRCCLTARDLVPTEVLGDGLGAGPIHVMNDARPGIIYCVSGTHLYLLNFGSRRPVGLSTDLGDVRHAGSDVR